MNDQHMYDEVVNHLKVVIGDVLVAKHGNIKTCILHDYERALTRIRNEEAAAAAAETENSSASHTLCASQLPTSLHEALIHELICDDLITNLNELTASCMRALTPAKLLACLTHNEFADEMQNENNDTDEVDTDVEAVNRQQKKSRMDMTCLALPTTCRRNEDDDQSAMGSKLADMMDCNEDDVVNDAATDGFDYRSMVKKLSLANSISDEEVRYRVYEDDLMERYLGLHDVLYVFPNKKYFVDNQAMHWHNEHDLVSNNDGVLVANFDDHDNDVSTANNNDGTSNTELAKASYGRLLITDWYMHDNQLTLIIKNHEYGMRRCACSNCNKSNRSSDINGIMGKYHYVPPTNLHIDSVSCQ
jgi:hypothetical protein